MKRMFFLLLAIVMLCSSVTPIFAESVQKSAAEYWDVYNPIKEASFDLEVKSAILTEAKTGTVLYEYNAEEALAPASVTKTMTLLLIAEALSESRIKVDDDVMISAHASSMGGSQVFLKEGEIMSVEELIKCTVIASANDAAVALAEHTMGSESAFVDAMNKRAEELALSSSSFENTTGLDDNVTNHTMSAKDIAIISRELIKHDIITKYSSVWQDSIRNGEFTLTNTNRLVRYYEGCTGLKTGSTDKAGFCVSATAKKGNTELIAVIMGAESGSKRNEAARTLLDYGFSNYSLYESQATDKGEIRTLGAKTEQAALRADGFFAVVSKSDINKVSKSYEIPDSVSAPLKKNTNVGRVVFKIGDEILGSANVYITEEVERIGFGSVFIGVLLSSFSG